MAWQGNYRDSYDGFRWHVPEHYNIGVDVCDGWAATEPERVALRMVAPDGALRDWSYGELYELSNRCANLLRSHGVKRGDRVGILLSQSVCTAIAHIAIYKLAAIAVPLFTLFGPDALAHRLKDSGAVALITDRAGLLSIQDIRTDLPELTTTLVTDDGDDAGFWAQIGASSSLFDPVVTKADDPALIIYTSGTTGLAKGALHAHRTLLGHLPGVEISHELFPHPGDCMWSPADWAWIGGLLDVLLPALHHGVPVVGCRFQKFEAKPAFALIERAGIRNAFLPPTALKTMRADTEAWHDKRFPMRSISSGGEMLGAELLDWGRLVFGVTINEFYGQTECNMVVCSCAAWGDTRPGLMGRAVPGHVVGVLDDSGASVGIGKEGDIAVLGPDPVMFLGYWNDAAASQAKFRGPWLITGDRAVLEPDGWLRFVGRDDDVITSSGYRIGPGSVEDCLLRHPSVAQAGVIGTPDAQRTEIVTAFIVLRQGISPDATLHDEIATFVKNRLARHEYPRRIHFVAELPKTTTGKIIRRQLRDWAKSDEW